MRLCLLLCLCLWLCCVGVCVGVYLRSFLYLYLWPYMCQRLRLSPPFRDGGLEENPQTAASFLSILDRLQAARCISHCRPLSSILSVCFLFVFVVSFLFCFRLAPTRLLSSQTDLERRALICLADRSARFRMGRCACALAERCRCGAWYAVP